MKTKAVKAFTISEGDKVSVGLERYQTVRTVKRISEIDRSRISFDYEEGGFGIYDRGSKLNKVIEA